MVLILSNNSAYIKSGQQRKGLLEAKNTASEEETGININNLIGARNRDYAVPTSEVVTTTMEEFSQAASDLHDSNRHLD
jgi:hypothetical protein